MKLFSLSKPKVADFLKKLYFPIAAIIVALLLGALIIKALGFNPVLAYGCLISGSLGNFKTIGETLNKAMPVAMTGLSFAIARRCGVVNLGAEGQLYMGALAAVLVGTNLGGLPPVLHITLAVAAGFLGGALYGLLVSFLKNRFGADELITTIMFNYIAITFCSYLVAGPIKNMESASNFPQSRNVLESAQLPRILSGTRLHAGLFIVIAAILFYYFFTWKTNKGYEMRVMGYNPTAGVYAGMNKNKVRSLVMFLAGGFAGLGGAIELLGVQHRLLEGFSMNFGFDGVAVALLGNTNPIGIGLSSILFGILRSGSNKMEMIANVPNALIYMIQGLIILFVIGRELLNIKFKIVQKSIGSDKNRKLDNKEVC